MAMIVNDLIIELDEARLIAKETGKASAMIAATMSKAKLLGLDNGVMDSDYVQPVKIVIGLEDARIRDIPIHWLELTIGNKIKDRANLTVMPYWAHPEFCVTAI